jgi:uncharacterized protein YebE (UPF0316 family)
MRQIFWYFIYVWICRFMGDIKMGLRDIGWGVMDWIDLAQDRDQWRALMNTVMSLRGP